MTGKWRYIVAGIVVVALGVLCSDNAQAKYVESQTLTVALNIEKHYYVSFNANGGTGSMSNQQFTVGTVQALTANAYTYSNHYFAGWNTSADGQGTAYTDEAMISTDLTNIGGSIVTLYAQWDEDPMHTVFEIDGTCIFHGYDIFRNVGDGHITGTNCSYGGTDWADGTHQYIDTGIKLYDSTNYSKDYEVGFTITAYDPDHQYRGANDSNSQATFFNAKLEDSTRHWPGIVVRRSNNNIEVTETITKPNGSYEKKTGSGGSSTPVKVVITRVDGIVYYSINSDTFTSLQNINNTSDYFNVNAWFGAAAQDDGTPMRYVDATLTDIYIKVGDTGANKHTVSFDAGGVVADPSSVAVVGRSKIGSLLPSMPNYVDTQSGRLYFIGWYSGIDGAGDKYDENSVITSNMTLHAYWNDELILCGYGGITRGDLQSCIDNAGAGDTITLYDDVRTQISTASGVDVVLDLNGHTLSDNNVAGQPVIENAGKITIINGTITSSLRAGVLNNTGEMHVGNGARIIATGSRQAIYNNGGSLEIYGDAYLSASSVERATVQNLANGTLEIKGGTIISVNQEAVKVESGTATIGVRDGTVDSTTPVLQGATNGLNTSVDVSMYDGILKGKNAAINNTSRITATEIGATEVGISSVATEVIDGVTYKVIYYQ